MEGRKVVEYFDGDAAIQLSNSDANQTDQILLTIIHRAEMSTCDFSKLTAAQRKEIADFILTGILPL